MGELVRRHLALLIFAFFVVSCGGSTEATSSASQGTDEPDTTDSDVSTTTTISDVEADPTTLTTPTTEAFTAEDDAEDEQAAQAGSLEDRRAELEFSIGVYSGLMGVDPDEAQMDCMVTDESIAVDPAVAEEESLPIVLMQMCMPDEIRATTIAQFEAAPDLTEENLADLTCIIDLGMSRVEGMSLQERLDDNGDRAEFEALVAEVCELTPEDLTLLESLG